MLFFVEKARISHFSTTNYYVQSSLPKDSQNRMLYTGGCIIKVKSEGQLCSRKSYFSETQNKTLISMS